MVKPSASGQTSKEEIIKAAKIVFASKGFDGATVKDICDQAGSNVSAVSYYFGGKEELYKACLESFGLNRLAAAERVLKAPESLEDFKVRMKMFLEEFIEQHLSEPEITSILHRECTSSNKVSRELFENIFMKVFEAFHKFFEAAHKKQILKAKHDSLIAAASVFGSVVHLLRTDSIAKEHFNISLESAKHRSKVIDQLVQQTVHGLAEGESR